MSFFDTVRISLGALALHKMRSVLTMLGIIIGVASVITTMAVGGGARAQVAEQIRSLGANLLMILPGAARQGGARMQTGSRQTLTEIDSEMIGSEIRHVQAASPVVRGSGQVVRGNSNWNTVVYGTTSDYFSIREWPLSAGRHFDQSEAQTASKVALIGSTLVKQLFGNSDPIGAQIRIVDVPFLVIGVLSEKGLSGTGVDQDDAIFVPITTAKLRLMGQEANRGAVAYIVVKAKSDKAMGTATAEIQKLLRQRHRLGSDQEDDFQITNPAAAQAAQRASTTTIAWLLASIASVSLVVGGISIMNIMLVSVTERTREIGLRLAVGARERDIRNQFVIEAVILCLVGGVIGVAIGIGVSAAIAVLAGWPILIGLDALLLAVGFAGAVGVFFGYYPARTAARLDPITALRME